MHQTKTKSRAEWAETTIIGPFTFFRRAETVRRGLENEKKYFSFRKAVFIILQFFPLLPFSESLIYFFPLIPSCFNGIFHVLFAIFFLFSFFFSRQSMDCYALRCRFLVTVDPSTSLSMWVTVIRPPAKKRDASNCL